MEAIVKEYAAMENLLFKKNGDTVVLENETRRGTFDQEAATKRVDLEFFAFGHELIDRYAHAIISETEKTPIVSIASSENGFLFFFSMSLELDKKYRRMYRVYLSKFGDHEKCPTILSQQAQAHFIDEDYLKLVTQKALARIETKILTDVESILKKIRPSESYWKNRIVDSAMARKNTIEEKLEIQRSKVKWYGEKFVGSVSRLSSDKRRSEQKEYERLQHSNFRLEPKITLELKRVCVLSSDS
ncbi:MAG TPA: hypothetical protein PLY93_09560 [Turneriella sp.]|nr:hypothetical protein [Turneriella sp.]